MFDIFRQFRIHEYRTVLSQLCICLQYLMFLVLLAYWLCLRYSHFSCITFLRTKNYLLDFIHSYFCYSNTIQYNTVQFMIFFVFLLYSFWSGRLQLRSNKTTVMGATFYGEVLTISDCQTHLLLDKFVFVWSINGIYWKGLDGKRYCSSDKAIFHQ